MDSFLTPSTSREKLKQKSDSQGSSTSQWQQSQRTTTQGLVSHHVNFTEEKYLQVVRSVATCRYTRDLTSHLVESLMVSRKALQCRMDPRRASEHTVATSMVSKMALVSVVVSLVPEMALHPTLNTVNQWVLKRALMAKCWCQPKLCNKRRRSQNKTSTTSFG